MCKTFLFFSTATLPDLLEHFVSFGGGSSVFRVLQTYHNNNNNNNNFYLDNNLPSLPSGIIICSVVDSWALEG